MVKSHRDTNAKGNGHRVTDRIRKRIAEIDSMHGERGRDGWELWGDDAECGKVTWTVRDESARSRVLRDITVFPP